VVIQDPNPHNPHGNSLSGNHLLQIQDPKPLGIRTSRGNNHPSGNHQQLQTQDFTNNNGPKFPTMMEETIKTEEMSLSNALLT
jgi:hypothetical protein